MKKLGLFMIFCCAGFVAAAQGLEDIIVERYYVSDANDATDEDGGSLTEGSVTYRIFVDMQEGWEIQAVYGNDDHLLRLETTTAFFNNEDRGEETGDAINDSRLDENTVALDSWVTMGPASDEHFGIPKNLDFDGSIVGGDNNDGGSEGIEGGLLANEDPSAGIPLTNADGLIPGQAPSGLVSVGLDLGIFADQNDGPIFTSNGGAWSVLEGVQGVTSDNIVLVAQITTDGDFSFELNIQLGGPAGQTEQYVASNPIGDEILFAGLTFPQSAVPGCVNSEACNFDPLATEDDGSCIEPVADCQACNASNTGLVIIDSDGDGICDADDTECIGDFDNSGIIGLSDLLLFLPEFGCSSDCNYDLNDSGSVDVNNLLIFLPLFGSTCE
ncbi:MAG: hypothetical protein O2984_00115 [Bacteroidetes bacterium]|nr:hypothetical protein [Bacteroidota bacterium]